MEGLLWRVRVAVLWVAMAVCMSATVISVIVTPGNTLMQGEAEGGPITTELLLFASLFWLVPLAMAVLTLALKDTEARWANAVVAIVAAVMWGSELPAAVIDGAAFSVEMLMSVVAVLIGLLIAWHAWKWPVGSESMA
jgi:hypothetical protein